MHLIVGLGNPGKKYDETRHNIGFDVIDRLSKDLDIAVKKEKCGALIGEGRIDNAKVILAKPQTFMNLSGDSVSSLVQWYKIDTAKIIVVFDDMDLEPGNLRIRPKGTSGGHKGAESIISSLKTNEFKRIRIGIGRSRKETIDHVLSKFSKTEKEEIDIAVNDAADAVQEIIKSGTDEAMNRFNSRSI